MSDPAPALRRLTDGEALQLQALHKRRQELRYPPGWPKPSPMQRRRSDQARAALVEKLTELWEDGVSLADLGAAIGVSKQRVQQLTTEGTA